MKRLLSHAPWVFLALFGLLLVAGCSTTDSQNASDRPWDSPKGWENGLPSSMTEGR